MTGLDSPLCGQTTFHYPLTPPSVATRGAAVSGAAVHTGVQTPI